MTEIWIQAALWLGLALIATLAAMWLRGARAKLAPESFKTHFRVMIGHPAKQIVRYTASQWYRSYRRRPPGTHAL